MVLLSIGFASDKCDLYNKLVELTDCFKEKGISIGLVESDNEDMHFIKCVVKDEDYSRCSVPQIKSSFDIYAANIIYQALVDNFQSSVISKIIRDNYNYFRVDEAADIINRCTNILNEDTRVKNGDFNYGSRKERVIEKIYEYISENTDIVLEGFIRFRLKELNSELTELVDKVVEEYLIEREYNEFIKLLKYFVEVQESRVEIVNVVVKGDGTYSMYDGDKNEITQDLLSEMADEGLCGEINYDDLLVSSLITAAPKFIVIHNLPNVKNREMIETINNVFCDRVKVCTGCSLCTRHSKNSKLDKG